MIFFSSHLKLLQKTNSMKINIFKNLGLLSTTFWAFLIKPTFEIIIRIEVSWKKQQLNFQIEVVKKKVTYQTFRFTSVHFNREVFLENPLF